MRHQLEEMDFDELSFQQDSVTCHISGKTMTEPAEIFPKCEISRRSKVNWLAISCDSLSCDFLWEYFEWKIDMPNSTTEVKDEILLDIGKIYMWSD